MDKKELASAIRVKARELTALLIKAYKEGLDVQIGVTAVYGEDSIGSYKKVVVP